MSPYVIFECHFIINLPELSRCRGRCGNACTPRSTARIHPNILNDIAQSFFLSRLSTYFFPLFLFTVLRFFFYLIVALFILIHFFSFFWQNSTIKRVFLLKSVWSYWILWNNWMSKWNHQLLFVMTPLYSESFAGFLH